MKQLIASTLCLAFLLPAVHAESDTSQRPDIVFIIVDDLNDWIGCLGGHPDAKSPNIDSLAEGGMLFLRRIAMHHNADLLERVCCTANTRSIREPISMQNLQKKRGQ